MARSQTDNLAHKDDWATPAHLIPYIKTNYEVNPTIDLCATKSNAKFEKFITPEMDLFTQEIKEDGFINAPYRKRGWTTLNKGKPNEKRIFNETGIEDFMLFVHKEHLSHNVTITSLVFTNVSSTKWFQQIVGERDKDRIKNHAELNLYPKRIQFLDDNGTPVGIPAFSSAVIVWRAQV
jgi:hypothetical protein